MNERRSRGAVSAGGGLPSSRRRPVPRPQPTRKRTMNPTAFSIAHQCVLDILAMREPPAGVVFRMRAVEPSTLPADRQARATRYASMVPAEATAADAYRIAGDIAKAMAAGSV